jgi:transitional endoplasmic reticulum ATPase
VGYAGHGWDRLDNGTDANASFLLRARWFPRDIDIDEEEIDAKILDSLMIDNEHFRHAMGVCNPSALRETQVEVPDVTWEDVGGLEDVKRELAETIQYPVEYAAKYEKFGAWASRGRRGRRRVGG